MQGFRPFSGKGHRIGGDEKRADDLDDGDVQLVTTDMDSGILHSYIRRLDNLKVVTSGWMHSLQKNDKEAPFQCLNDLDHLMFHIVGVVSQIEARSLDSQSARSIVETAEHDFARLRLEVSPFISGGPMDTDAQGNDTQGSNATQDARGSAVDTQGSSTEQMPGADGVEELFADLLNDVEGNDAKGQGKGNGEPDRDDPFEGLDGDETGNFIKDGEHRAIEYGASVSMMMSFGVDDDAEWPEKDADLKLLDGLNHRLQKRQKYNRKRLHVGSGERPRKKKAK